jgi:plasmid stability protein
LQHPSLIAYVACNEGDSLQAKREMAQLTVRNVDDRVVRALKRRAAGHGCSAEAEHREILRRALLQEDRTRESVAERARALRRRLKSGIDSTDLIRADRDRDTSP